MNVEDLKPGMNNVTVVVRIIAIGEMKEFIGRDGRPRRIITLVVSDETGDIELVLWNRELGDLTEGDTVEVRNAFVNEFRGKTQLNVGRYGEIKRVAPP